MQRLTDGGRADLACTLATNTTYPSWGCMISKGATTIWALWNGDTAYPAMNSGNHVMLVGDLRFVRATHRSPCGLVASAWRQANGRFDWEITVPSNPTATVFIPARNAAGITERGRLVAQAQGARFLRHEDGCAVCAVASGRYHFTNNKPARRAVSGLLGRSVAPAMAK